MAGAEVDIYTSVKNRVFSHDVRRAGMVVGIRKVCAVHQRPCALVPAYHPAVDVLDHDVVWWLAKFFCKILAASVSTSSHFCARPRGNINAATIRNAMFLMLRMVQLTMA